MYWQIAHIKSKSITVKKDILLTTLQLETNVLVASFIIIFTFRFGRKKNLYVHFPLDASKKRRYSTSTVDNFIGRMACYSVCRSDYCFGFFSSLILVVGRGYIWNHAKNNLLFDRTSKSNIWHETYVRNESELKRSAHNAFEWIEFETGSGSKSKSKREVPVSQLRLLLSLHVRYYYSLCHYWNGNCPFPSLYIECNRWCKESYIYFHKLRVETLVLCIEIPSEWQRPNEKWKWINNLIGTAFSLESNSLCAVKIENNECNGIGGTMFWYASNCYDALSAIFVR